MAAKAAVTAGDECAVLKRCPQHGQDLKQKSGTKRKAEAAPEGDESPLKICSTKRKASGIDCSELEQGATPTAAAAAARREEAPERKMTRLPQEEVDSILTEEMDDETLPPEYRALKRLNPDLIPSPEEEMDEDVVSFYDVVRFFYERGEDFREFQAWVRTEHAKNGYVEVDDEYLRHQEEMEAMNEEARKEALKAFDFSGLLDF